MSAELIRAYEELEVFQCFKSVCLITKLMTC